MSIPFPTMHQGVPKSNDCLRDHFWPAIFNSTSSAFCWVKEQLPDSFRILNPQVLMNEEEEEEGEWWELWYYACEKTVN